MQCCFADFFNERNIIKNIIEARIFSDALLKVVLVLEKKKILHGPPKTRYITACRVFVIDNTRLMGLDVFIVFDITKHNGG